MAITTTTIYPPIVPDIKPAFRRYASCYIFFNISQYTNINDIDTDLVQVTIVNQKTNKTILSQSLYPLDIKLAPLQEVNADTLLAIGSEQIEFYDIKDSYPYYIEIAQADLAGNGFLSNEVYKVQMRFTAVGHSTPVNVKSAAWFENNRNYFSEWSTVTIIKAISDPTLTLNNMITFPPSQDTSLLYEFPSL